MKTSYTTFHGAVKKYLKLSKINEEEFVRAVERANKFGNFDEQNQANDYGRAYQVEKKIDSGKAVHLFMPDRAFCDWLVSCVKESNAAHAYFIQKLIGVSNAGVFHFPCSAKLDSFAFYIPNMDVRSNDSGLPGAYRIVKKGSWIYVDGGASQKDFHMFSCEIGGEHTLTKPIAHYIVKLICGLGMYASCFPEVIKPGAPVNLKHPAHHNHPAMFNVEVAPEVFSAGGTHASPEAHFREGHFRVLRSEKFVNMRFQAVWVRETFVKGKCVTILPPEEVP